MAEKDHQQIANSRKAADHEAERVLDVALAKYASVEPRAGLEARILATLHAQQQRVPQRALWRLALAAAVTAILVVAVSLAWKSGGPTHPVDATAKPSPQHRGTQLASKKGGSQVRADHGLLQKHLTRRAVLRRSRPDDDSGEAPKLDQFPSPRPLSQEEILLVQYVQKFPVEAVMVAKLQAESEKEIEQLGGNQPPGNNPDREQDPQER